MSTLNNKILSEINAISSDDMRKFLLWLLLFEYEKSDKNIYAYKTQIENKVKQILLNKINK